MKLILLIEPLSFLVSPFLFTNKAVKFFPKELMKQPSFLLLVVVFFLLVSPSFSALFVAKCGGSYTWSSASSWDRNSVPSSNDDVRIPLCASSTLELSVTSSTTVSRITMEGSTLRLSSSVTLTCSNFNLTRGTVSGVSNSVLVVTSTLLSSSCNTRYFSQVAVRSMGSATFARIIQLQSSARLELRTVTFNSLSCSGSNNPFITSTGTAAKIEFLGSLTCNALTTITVPNLDFFASCTDSSVSSNRFTAETTTVNINTQTCRHARITASSLSVTTESYISPILTLTQSANLNRKLHILTSLTFTTISATNLDVTGTLVPTSASSSTITTLTLRSSAAVSLNSVPDTVQFSVTNLQMLSGVSFSRSSGTQILRIANVQDGSLRNLALSGVHLEFSNCKIYSNLASTITFNTNGRLSLTSNSIYEVRGITLTVNGGDRFFVVSSGSRITLLSSSSLVCNVIMSCSGSIFSTSSALTFTRRGFIHTLDTTSTSLTINGHSSSIFGIRRFAKVLTTLINDVGILLLSEQLTGIPSSVSDVESVFNALPSVVSSRVTTFSNRGGTTYAKLTTNTLTLSAGTVHLLATSLQTINVEGGSLLFSLGTQASTDVVSLQANGGTIGIDNELSVRTLSLNSLFTSSVVTITSSSSTGTLFVESFFLSVARTNLDFLTIKVSTVFRWLAGNLLVDFGSVVEIVPSAVMEVPSLGTGTYSAVGAPAELHLYGMLQVDTSQIFLPWFVTLYNGYFIDISPNSHVTFGGIHCTTLISLPHNSIFQVSRLSSVFSDSCIIKAQKVIFGGFSSSSSLIHPNFILDTVEDSLIIAAGNTTIHRDSYLLHNNWNLEITGGTLLLDFDLNTTFRHISISSGSLFTRACVYVPSLLLSNGLSRWGSVYTDVVTVNGGSHFFQGTLSSPSVVLSGGFLEILNKLECSFMSMSGSSPSLRGSGTAFCDTLLLTLGNIRIRRLFVKELLKQTTSSALFEYSNTVVEDIFFWSQGSLSMSKLATITITSNSVFNITSSANSFSNSTFGGTVHVFGTLTSYVINAAVISPALINHNLISCHSGTLTLSGYVEHRGVINVENGASLWLGGMVQYIVPSILQGCGVFGFSLNAITVLTTKNYMFNSIQTAGNAQVWLSPLFLSYYSGTLITTDTSTVSFTTLDYGVLTSTLHDSSNIILPKDYYWLSNEDFHVYNNASLIHNCEPSFDEFILYGGRLSCLNGPLVINETSTLVLKGVSSHNCYSEVHVYGTLVWESGIIRGFSKCKITVMKNGVFTTSESLDGSMPRNTVDIFPSLEIFGTIIYQSSLSATIWWNVTLHDESQLLVQSGHLILNGNGIITKASVISVSTESTLTIRGLYNFLSPTLRLHADGGVFFTGTGVTHFYTNISDFVLVLRNSHSLYFYSAIPPVRILLEDSSQLFYLSCSSLIDVTLSSSSFLSITGSSLSIAILTMDGSSTLFGCDYVHEFYFNGGTVSGNTFSEPMVIEELHLSTTSEKNINTRRLQIRDSAVFSGGTLRGTNAVVVVEETANWLVLYARSIYSGGSSFSFHIFGNYTMDVPSVSISHQIDIYVWNYFTVHSGSCSVRGLFSVDSSFLVVNDQAFIIVQGNGVLYLANNAQVTGDVRLRASTISLNHGQDFDLSGDIVVESGFVANVLCSSIYCDNVSVNIILFGSLSVNSPVSILSMDFRSGSSLQGSQSLMLNYTQMSGTVTFIGSGSTFFLLKTTLVDCRPSIQNTYALHFFNDVELDVPSSSMSVSCQVSFTDVTIILNGFTVFNSGSSNFQLLFFGSNSISTPSSSTVNFRSSCGIRIDDLTLTSSVGLQVYRRIEINGDLIVQTESTLILQSGVTSSVFSTGSSLLVYGRIDVLSGSYNVLGLFQTLPGSTGIISSGSSTLILSANVYIGGNFNVVGSISGTRTLHVESTSVLSMSGRLAGSSSIVCNGICRFSGTVSLDDQSSIISVSSFRLTSNTLIQLTGSSNFTFSGDSVLIDNHDLTFTGFSAVGVVLEDVVLTYHSQASLLFDVRVALINTQLIIDSHIDSISFHGMSDFYQSTVEFSTSSLQFLSSSVAVDTTFLGNTLRFSSGAHVWDNCNMSATVFLDSSSVIIASHVGSSIVVGPHSFSQVFLLGNALFEEFILIRGDVSGAELTLTINHFELQPISTCRLIGGLRVIVIDSASISPSSTTGFRFPDATMVFGLHCQSVFYRLTSGGVSLNGHVVLLGTLISSTPVLTFTRPLEVGQHALVTSGHVNSRIVLSASSPSVVNGTITVDNLEGNHVRLGPSSSIIVREFRVVNTEAHNIFALSATDKIVPQTSTVILFNADFCSRFSSSTDSLVHINSISPTSSTYLSSSFGDLIIGNLELSSVFVLKTNVIVVDHVLLSGGGISGPYSVTVSSFASISFIQSPLVLLEGASLVFDGPVLLDHSASFLFDGCDSCSILFKDTFTVNLFNDDQAFVLFFADTLSVFFKKDFVVVHGRINLSPRFSIDGVISDEGTISFLIRADEILTFPKSSGNGILVFSHGLVQISQNFYSNLSLELHGTTFGLENCDVSLSSLSMLSLNSVDSILIGTNSSITLRDSSLLSGHFIGHDTGLTLSLDGSSELSHSVFEGTVILTHTGKELFVTGVVRAQELNFSHSVHLIFYRNVRISDSFLVTDSEYQPLISLLSSVSVLSSELEGDSIVFDWDLSCIKSSVLASELSDIRFNSYTTFFFCTLSLSESSFFASFIGVTFNSSTVFWNFETNGLVSVASTLSGNVIVNNNAQVLLYASILSNLYISAPDLIEISGYTSVSSLSSNVDCVSITMIDCLSTFTVSESFVSLSFVSSCPSNVRPSVDLRSAYGVVSGDVDLIVSEPTNWNTVSVNICSSCKLLVDSFLQWSDSFPSYSFINQGFLVITTNGHLQLESTTDYDFGISDEFDIRGNLTFSGFNSVLISAVTDDFVLSNATLVVNSLNQISLTISGHFVLNSIIVSPSVLVRCSEVIKVLNEFDVSQLEVVTGELSYI
ncbi:hypothetical protein RCL1_003468 [Eukaryota sp. TZLM3-RCL]